MTENIKKLLIQFHVAMGVLKTVFVGTTYLEIGIINNMPLRFFGHQNEINHHYHWIVLNVLVYNALAVALETSCNNITTKMQVGYINIL